MTTFRIHTRSGETFDIDADTPNEARKIFIARHPKTIIKKVKVVKGGEQ